MIIAHYGAVYYKTSLVHPLALTRSPNSTTMDINIARLKSSILFINTNYIIHVYHREQPIFIRHPKYMLLAFFAIV